MSLLSSNTSSNGIFLPLLIAHLIIAKSKEIPFEELINLIEYIPITGDLPIMKADAGEVLEWSSRTEQNFHKFFSLPSNSGSANSDILFYDYDLIIKERIFKRTVSSFPLFSGLVSDQEAKALVKWLSEPDFCAEYDTIASTDEKEEGLFQVLLDVSRRRKQSANSNSKKCEH